MEYYQNGWAPKLASWLSQNRHWSRKKKIVVFGGAHKASSHTCYASCWKELDTVLLQICAALEPWFYMYLVVQDCTVSIVSLAQDKRESLEQLDSVVQQRQSPEMCNTSSRGSSRYVLVMQNMSKRIRWVRTLRPRASVTLLVKLAVCRFLGWFSNVFLGFAGAKNKAHSRVMGLHAGQYVRCTRQKCNLYPLNSVVFRPVVKPSLP